MKEYTDKYTMKTDRIDSVREQAKYEVGLEKFLSANGIGAFADTFQDLHGLKQLPGRAFALDSKLPHQVLNAYQLAFFTPGISPL